ALPGEPTPATTVPLISQIARVPDVWRKRTSDLPSALKSLVTRMTGVACAAANATTSDATAPERNAEQTRALMGPGVDASLDDLIRRQQQRWRDVEAKRLRRLEIDHLPVHLGEILRSTARWAVACGLNHRTPALTRACSACSTAPGSNPREAAARQGS